MSKISINDVKEGQFLKFKYRGKLRIGLVVPPASHIHSTDIITMNCIESEDNEMGELKYKSFKKELIESTIELLSEED